MFLYYYVDGLHDLSTTILVPVPGGNFCKNEFLTLIPGPAFAQRGIMA